MKTKRNHKKLRKTRSKKRGGGDAHKSIKDLLHTIRTELFETNKPGYSEIISKHNTSIEKSNKRDLNKYEQLFPENASSEEIEKTISTYKTCVKFIREKNNKISEGFFKIYTNQGRASRDAFIKKYILKDFIEKLKKSYSETEHKNVISNPNQGFFSKKTDYSDPKQYLDHIKRNYVDAFELPTSIQNEMLGKGEKNKETKGELYITPRVTLVNIGTIRDYKDNKLFIEKHEIKTEVFTDDFIDLYVQIEYKNKREKFISKTENCTKPLMNTIKNYKIHVKTTDKLDNIKKLVDENNISAEEIYVSDDLEDDEMDGGK
jgi:hypothetical protein